MATSGTEDTICSMCLDTYTNPKFLPCHHTFCEGCIEDLAQKHKGRKFPCPSCRKVTSLPHGGATDLQTNFYIKIPAATTPTPRAKTKAPAPSTPSPRTKTPVCKVQHEMCPSHPDKQIDFYCAKCDAIICLYCKLTSHEGHKTFDIDSAVEFKKKKTSENRQRIVEAMSEVEGNASSLKERREELEKQRASVERDIKERRSAVVEAAKKHMEVQLKTLQSSYTDLDKGIVDDIEECSVNLTKLSNLLKEIDVAIKSPFVKKVMDVATEMSSGRGSRSAVEDMADSGVKPGHMPALQSKTSTNVMLQTTRDYIGRVEGMEAKTMQTKTKPTPHQNRRR